MHGLEKAKTKFLLYHDLASLCGGDASKARELFRRQIALMAGWGFAFRSMSEFLSGEASGSKDVVVTFDDGGRSFVDCALPVLKEFSATATMFVVAGFPGCHGREMDFLDWDEIADLAAQGIDIGSHALSHLPLVDLEPDKVRREVFGGQGLRPSRTCTDHVRLPVRTPVRHRQARCERLRLPGRVHHQEGRPRRLRTQAAAVHARRARATGKVLLADNYFPVRKAIVSVVPERLRREGKPIPREIWGADGFGIDGRKPPV